MGGAPATRLCLLTVDGPWRRRSQTEPSLAPEPPVDAAGVPHHAGDLPTKLLLQHRRPGHELEAEPVVDQGEPARGERQVLTVGPRNLLTGGGWKMGQSGLGRQPGPDRLQLAPSSPRGPPARNRPWRGPSADARPADGRARSPPAPSPAGPGRRPSGWPVPAHLDDAAICGACSKASTPRNRT